MPPPGAAPSIPGPVICNGLSAPRYSNLKKGNERPGSIPTKTSTSTASTLPQLGRPPSPIRQTGERPGSIPTTVSTAWAPGPFPEGRWPRERRKPGKRPGSIPTSGSTSRAWAPAFPLRQAAKKGRRREATPGRTTGEYPPSGGKWCLYQIHPRVSRGGNAGAYTATHRRRGHCPKCVLVVTLRVAELRGHLSALLGSRLNRSTPDTPRRG